MRNLTLFIIGFVLLPIIMIALFAGVSWILSLIFQATYTEIMNSSIWMIYAPIIVVSIYFYSDAVEWGED